MMPQPDTGPDMLSAALDYVAKGWRVFPCHTIREGRCSCRDGVDCSSPGKHPMTQKGLHDASTDPAQIRKWWGYAPDANIGLCTGGGRFVLDVDHKNGGTTAGLDIPDTLRCATGGGEHHYFIADGHVPCSVSLVAPGIDIRGEGGYVIAPPSLHYSGRRYEWDYGGEDRPVPAPEWLLDRARKRRVQDPPRTGEEAAADAFLSGGRNAGLTQLAGAMVRKGFAFEAVAAALLVENERRCKPPLDEQEVVRIARSVCRYSPTDPVNGGDGERILTGVELGEPLEPIDWTLEALGLAPGPVSLAGGYGYSGKTVAWQAAMLAIAAGQLVWGAHSAQQGVCLHIDYEQGPRLTRERYQRLSIGLGTRLDQVGDQLRVVCYPRYYLDKPEGLAALRELCQGVRLCVIDSFKAAFPSLEENSADARKHLDQLSRISEETGCTILIIHHARKASKDDVGGSAQTLRGSGAIFDACQSVIVMAGRKGERPRVEHVKDRLRGRPAEPFELEIADVPGISPFPDDDGRETPRAGLSVRTAGIGEDEAFGEVMREVMSVLRAHPDGLSGKMLREACGDRRALSVDRARDRLVKDGYAERVKRGGRGGGWLYCPSTTGQVADIGEDFDEN